MRTIKIYSKTYAIADKEALATLETKEILTIFNKLSGRTTTKFSSRDKGIEQAWKLIEGLPEDEFLPSQEITPPKEKKVIDPVLSAKQKEAEKLRRHGANGRYISNKTSAEVKKSA